MQCTEMLDLSLNLIPERSTCNMVGLYTTWTYHMQGGHWTIICLMMLMLLMLLLVLLLMLLLMMLMLMLSLHKSNTVNIVNHFFFLTIHFLGQKIHENVKR